MLTTGKRKWLIIVCFVIVLVALAATSYFIPVQYDICAKDDHTGQKECATYHIVPFIFLYVGEFLETHNGAITAIATGFIAWFTFILWRATTEQGRLTQKSIGLTQQSIDLSRAEFIASHRPQFKIISARIVQDHPILAKFKIINIGTSDGTVVRSAVYLNYLVPNNRPSLDMVPRNNSIEPGLRLCVGMSCTCEVRNDSLSIGARPDGMVLYLFGWVEYRDAMDNPRTTYFFRPYIHNLECFGAADEPNCEQNY